MSKHTPAPWNVTGFERIVVNDSLGRTLALAPGSSNDLDEMKANAALIAAAPDMLAALQDILDLWDDPNMPMGDLLARVRAAIAKAEGGAGSCGK